MASKVLNANAGFLKYSFDPNTWYDASDYGTGFSFMDMYPGGATNQGLLRFASAGVDNTKITGIVITLVNNFSPNSESINGLSLNIGFSTTKTFVEGTATDSVNLTKPSGGGDVTANLTWTGTPGISLNSTWYLSFSVRSGATSGNRLDPSLKTITIHYSNATACGAPTSVTVSENNVRPGTDVTLFWSGATAGTDNAIIGYDIYRSTVPTSGYTLLASVASAGASGSTVVTSHEVKGASYYYKVVTKGAAGAAYDSGQSSATATLTTALYGNTIGYYQDGNFALCEVYYFDGAAFVECIPYYRQDGAWAECHSG